MTTRSLVLVCAGLVLGGLATFVGQGLAQEAADEVPPAASPAPAIAVPNAPRVEATAEEAPPEAIDLRDLMLSSPGVPRRELRGKPNCRQRAPDDLEYTWVLYQPGTDEIGGVCRAHCVGGLLEAVSWRIRGKPAAATKWIDAAEAWQVAVAYAEPILRRAFGDAAEELYVTRGELPSPDTDAYVFSWSVCPGYRPGEARLAVHVNAFTGHVTHAWLVFQRPPPDPEEVARLRARAFEKLAARFREEGLPRLDDTRVISERHAWVSRPEGRHYRWCANCIVSDELPPGPEALVSVVYVKVDPEGEGIVAFERGEVPAEQVRIARREGLSLAYAGLVLHPIVEVDGADDERPLPVLSGEAVAFLSTRDFEGYPPWRNEDRYVALVSLEDGTPRALTFHEDRPCTSVAANRAEGWLAYVSADELTLRNVTTGETYSLDEEHSNLPHPVFMPSRGSCVLGPTSIRSGQDRWMVFEPPASGARRLRATPVAGLSQSDRAVYLNLRDDAAAIVAKDRAGLRLDIADVSPQWAFSNRRTLTSGFQEEPAVSWLADDGRLLVHERRLAWDAEDEPQAPARVEHILAVVDAATGERTPLEWPPLRDPETGDELTLFEASVRALRGDVVVFSARAQAWPPDIGARIYACNLDGSELKRVTPLDGEPIPIYEFPQSGEPAFAWPFADKAAGR